MIFKYKRYIETGYNKHLVYLERCEFVKDYLIENSLNFKENSNFYYLEYDTLSMCFYNEIQIGDSMMVIEKEDVWDLTGRIYTVNSKIFDINRCSGIVKFKEKCFNTIDEGGIFCGYLQFEPEFYKNKIRLKKLNQVFNK